MRGTDEQQNWMFSYGSTGKRVPEDHPLSVIRTMAVVFIAPSLKSDRTVGGWS
jgi:hypothetical protein